MIRKTAMLGGLLLATGLALPAMAQDSAIRIVMGEDVDLLEPCMSTQSTIGAVLLQNISETLTYLDVAGGTGLQLQAAEFGTLVHLGVRAQAQPVLGGELGHALLVAVGGVQVDHQRGRFDGVRALADQGAQAFRYFRRCFHPATRLPGGWCRPNPPGSGHCRASTAGG